MISEMKFDKNEFMKLNNYEEMVLHTLQSLEYLDDGMVKCSQEEIQSLLDCFISCLKNNKILNAYAIKKAINYSVKATNDFELYKVYILFAAKCLPEGLFEAFHFDFYATPEMANDEEFRVKFDELIDNVEETLHMA